jgi:hypothetical protein
MRYKQLVKKLMEHQDEVADILKAIHEGEDLKVAADRLFVTFGRTRAIIDRFDADEQVAPDA